MSNIAFLKVSEPIGYNTFSLFNSLKKVGDKSEIVLLDDTSFIQKKIGFLNRKTIIEYYSLGIKFLAEEMGCPVSVVKKESDIIKYNRDRLRFMLRVAGNIEVGENHDESNNKHTINSLEKGLTLANLMTFLDSFKENESKMFVSNYFSFLDMIQKENNSFLRVEEAGQLREANLLLNVHFSNNRNKIKAKLNKLIKALCVSGEVGDPIEVLTTIFENLVSSFKKEALISKKEIKKRKLEKRELKEMVVDMLCSSFNKVAGKFNFPKSKRIFKNFEKINEVFCS